MNWLRQSTASQEVLLGPFMDQGDGITPLTALTIANTDIKVWKRGATSEANKNSGGATHIAAGRYYAVLDATDTNTFGSGEINVHMSGALPIKVKFVVLPNYIFDWFIDDSGAVNVNTASFTAGSLTAAAFAANAINAAKLDPDVATELQNGLATAAALATVSGKIDTIDDFLDTEIAAIKAKTDNLPSDPADASDIASSFSTVNTKLDTIDDFLDTEVAAIKAKTDNLPSDPADASVVAGLIAAVETKVDTVDTVVDGIAAKTVNLPSDPADASDIAALIDALPTAAENAAALMDLSNGIETSITPRQALRLILAASAGKLSGAATTTVTIRNVGDSKNRITATVDSDGNRSAVTVDAT